MRKPGCIEPIDYFINAEGHHILAPYSNCPPPPGYRTEYMDTLAEVDRIQSILNAQEMRNAEAEIADEDARAQFVNEKVRSALLTRSRSSDCSQFERDFIEEYTKLKDEKKRKKHRDAFLCHTGYLWARENNTPKGRGTDQEIVNIDRIDL